MLLPNAPLKLTGKKKSVSGTSSTALYADELHDGRSSSVLFEVSTKPPDRPRLESDTAVQGEDGAVQGEIQSNSVLAPSMMVFDEMNRCVLVTSPARFGLTRA